MKMSFNGWVIYDRLDGAWQIVAIVSDCGQTGVDLKELIKAGLTMNHPEPRVYSHSKGNDIAWRLPEGA